MRIKASYRIAAAVTLAVIIGASVISIIKTKCTQIDRVVPQRKDVIDWLGNQQVETHLNLEEARSLLFKEACCLAVFATREWQAFSQKYGENSELVPMAEGDGYPYEFVCGAIRTDIYMLYTDYCEATNYISNMIAADCRELSRPTDMLKIDNRNLSNTIEVMDGIRLWKNEYAVYTKLTNFYYDIINEELDGIANNRTKVNSLRRDFGNRLLNNMVWKERRINK